MGKNAQEKKKKLIVRSEENKKNEEGSYMVGSKSKEWGKKLF